ncbi:hypothetical protein [Streptomyces agglomeratus]|nr:hypothetical protein [Streptomyces agglomeratus]
MEPEPVAEVGVDITRTPPAEGDTPHAGTTPALTLSPTDAPRPTSPSP